MDTLGILATMIGVLIGVFVTRVFVYQTTIRPMQITLNRLQQDKRQQSK